MPLLNFSTLAGLEAAEKFGVVVGGKHVAPLSNLKEVVFELL